MLAGKGDQTGATPRQDLAEERWDRFFQELNKFWVHEFEVVGYFEDVHSLELHAAWKAGSKAISMLLFHDEDAVGPTNVVFIDGPLRFRACASRTNRKGGVVAEDALCSWATPLIAAADEQDVRCCVARSDVARVSHLRLLA